MCAECAKWCAERSDPNWKPKSSFGRIKNMGKDARAWYFRRGSQQLQTTGPVN